MVLPAISDVVGFAETGVMGFVNDDDVVFRLLCHFHKRGGVSPGPVVRRYRLRLRPVVMGRKLLSAVGMYQHHAVLASLHDWDADVQPFVQLVLPLATASGGA